MVNDMLNNSSLPFNLWGGALLCECHILNKIPQENYDKSTYELWKGRKPSYKYLKVWGCLAKVALPPRKTTRLGPKIIDCVYLGYANNSSAYRFLVIKFDVDTISVNSIIKSRDAKVFKLVFPYNKSETIHKQYDVASTSQDVNSENDEPRRSKRPRIETSFGPYFISYFTEGDLKPFTRLFPLQMLLFGGKLLTVQWSLLWQITLGT